MKQQPKSLDSKINLSTRISRKTMRNLITLSNRHTGGDIGKVIDELVRSYMRASR